MVAHDFDQPVINLHELTNGLMKYYSPTFNQEVLGKPNDGKPWGYYQSLSEITDLLHSVEHYKTSRLAHYHIKRRQDSMAEQVPFYEYLNENFYIISAQRDNLLEHGLSWCIQAESKKLNVYSHQEKIDTFSDIYKNKITIQPQALIKYLDQYVEYLAWVDNHFNVSSYFKYEEDLPRIEEYILGLSIFNNQKKQSWQDIFQIEFKDWNRCHYLISDLSGISNQLATRPQLTFDSKTNELDFQIQSVEKKNIPSSLSVYDRNFLTEKGPAYAKSFKAIQELVENKVLVTPVPIKLQTMLEKKLLIKNFDECVEVYNKWVKEKGVGTPYTLDDINQGIKEEIQQWHTVPQLK
jgi:hypothetical protein